jgi:hypothetical protein
MEVSSGKTFIPNLMQIDQSANQSIVHTAYVRTNRRFSNSVFRKEYNCSLGHVQLLKMKHSQCVKLRYNPWNRVVMQRQYCTWRHHVLLGRAEVYQQVSHLDQISHMYADTGISSLRSGICFSRTSNNNMAACKNCVLAFGLVVTNNEKWCQMWGFKLRGKI